MIKRVISCLVLCGIILASPISAQALSDHQPDSISENTSEDSETLRRIVDGPVTKYITFANSTPIEFFKYTNVDGKTSLRISFTETGAVFRICDSSAKTTGSKLLSKCTWWK